MSNSVPQGTQRGSHGEPLLPQAGEWDAGNDGAGGFLDPSSFLTPTDYATEGLVPTNFGAAAMTSPIGMAAVSAGPISPAPYLSSHHHQLQPQNYFAVADNINDDDDNNSNSGIDAYAYYQDQHGIGTSFAAGNVMVNVPVAQDYSQDAWMGGMNSGSIDATVASGAGVMPLQSSSSSQSFEPMAFPQYHGPAAAADGLEYQPSPLSAPGSHTMQSPWSPQWDGIQGPAMPMSAAAGQSVVSGGTLINATPIGTHHKGKGVVVDALGGGPPASSSSSSPSSAAAVLNPVAQHAGNAHGFPADHHASPGGDRRGSCCSIAPGSSGHASAAHLGCQHQHQPAYGYPGGHLAASCGSSVMDAYSPGAHAMGDVVQSPTAGIELDYPTGTDLKKEDLRRRNRMAANKCRAKAKEGEMRLQTNAWFVSGGWTDLAATAGKLTTQVRALRKEVRRHAHCEHPLIQEYLRHAEPLTESDDEGDGADSGVTVARHATL